MPHAPRCGLTGLCSRRFVQLAAVAWQGAAAALLIALRAVLVLANMLRHGDPFPPRQGMD